MAVNSTGSEDAWQRQALIAVDDGTSTMTMEAVTETIDLDIGERGFDMIALINLGQIPKHSPVGITTVTIEGYPLQVGSTSAGAVGGFWEFFANKPLADSGPSQPLDVDISNTLTRYRVAVLWTDDSTPPTDASTATAASTAGKRFVIADCFCTSYKESFTDGVLKATIMFKGVAFDKSADPNIKMESHNDGAIPTLGSYTPSSSKWAA